MKKRNLWLIGGGLLLAAVIGLIIWQRMMPSQDYKIGVLYPLTGPAAAIGETNQNGVLLAVEDINNQGGINGRKIVPVLLDSKTDPKAGVTEFNKAVTLDQVPVVLTASSGVCMALAPLADEQKIVLFADCSHPQVTQNRTYVFRNFPTGEMETSPMATFISQKLKINSLGLITANDDYGLGLSESIKKFLNGSTVSIRYEDTFDRAGQDFVNQVDKVIAAKPDAIYIGGYGKSLGIFIKQLRERGFKGQILAGLGLMVADARAAAGDFVNGVYVAVPNFDVGQDTRLSEFKQRYKNKFGKDAPFNAALTYDTTFMVAEAIKKSGYTSEQIKTALPSLQNFQGITGTLSIQANGDVKSDVGIGKFENGQVNPQ